MNSIIAYRVFSTYPDSVSINPDKVKRFYSLRHFMGLSFRWKVFPLWGDARCYCHHDVECVYSDNCDGSYKDLLAAAHLGGACNCISTCGFYALKLRELAFDYRELNTVHSIEPYFIVGKVELAGIVQEYESGYRASKGRILEIYFE